MLRTAFVVGLVFATACGSSREERGDPCPGLDVRILESVVTPPANISARVRVTECSGKALSRPLGEENFELAEDGRVLPSQEALRRITPTSRGREQRTLIALDLSGSIVRSGLREPMIAGAKQLAAELIREGGPEGEHEVAIFGFDGRAELVPFTFFTHAMDEVSAALAAAQNAPLIDDSTNLNGAVVSALGVLDGAVVEEEDRQARIAHGALVVFTDGNDLAGRVRDEEVQDALDDTSHSTFAIGVGLDLDRESLSRIGRTHTAVASGPEQVIEAFTEIGQELRARAGTDYLVSYCSPSRSGSRTLALGVTAGGLRGEARIAFDANGFGAGCTPDVSALR